MTTLFDDADVIHTHTRSQAITAGTLINESEQAAEAGFVWSVALTREAWADLVA